MMTLGRLQTVYKIESVLHESLLREDETSPWFSLARQGICNHDLAW